MLGLGVPLGFSVTSIPDNVNQHIQSPICISLRLSQINLSFGKLGKSLFVLYPKVNQVVYLLIMSPYVAARAQSRIDEEFGNSF